jgi:D-serine deaminase-like pyridoxal phosphate-dependent protein
MIGGLGERLSALPAMAYLYSPVSLCTHDDVSSARVVTQRAMAFESLDTPALLVDLAAADRNIERMMKHFRDGAVAVRPHLKTVKSPAFARRLLDAGARGVCVAKLSEAEVMAAAGIEDILITTELAGAPKLDRLVRLLADHPQIKLVVDSVAGADALARALNAAALSASVLLDLDVGQRRCGVLPGEPALALGAHVRGLPALRLIGVQGYEGHLQLCADADARERQCRDAMALLRGTAEALRAQGHELSIVTTGGTGTALICKSCPGITEVQPGSFVFMDSSYRRVLGGEHEAALTVLSTVISRPRPGEAVIDAGLKSLSTDSGFAEPKDRPGLSYRPAGDEHGILSWDAAARGLTSERELRVGDRVELIPSHIDTTVNLHDHYHVCVGDRVDAVWPISARGKVQ